MAKQIIKEAIENMIRQRLEETTNNPYYSIVNWNNGTILYGPYNTYKDASLSTPMMHSIKQRSEFSHKLPPKVRDFLRISYDGEEYSISLKMDVIDFIDEYTR